MKLAGNTIRAILSLLLLWVVWHHAHWSVALCLTLNCLAWEVLSAIRNRERERDSADRETHQLLERINKL